MRVLLVSSRGHSEVLQMRPRLADLGYRIFSLDAFDAADMSSRQPAVDTTLASFRGWRALSIDPEFIRAVGETVNRIRPHIVHIDADRRVHGHAMAALLRFRQVPVLVRRGAIGGLNLLNPGDWLCFFGRRRQKLLCASEAMAEAYARSPLLGCLLPRDRLKVLHLHVPDTRHLALSREAARQALAVPAEAMIVGTTCAIRRVKNVGTVAAAIQRLRGEFPQLLLLVLGGLKDRREVEAIRAMLGNDGVVLAGVVPFARNYLNAIDIFVSPTRAPGEGFGLAIAEAMLAGRPIITSNAGAGPELIGKAGLVVPALSIDGWCEAIRILMLDAGMRASLGGAARARALEIFDQETIATRLASIYDSTIKAYPVQY